MKKILGISLVAVLAVTPLMARADTNPSAYALAEYNSSTQTGDAGIQTISDATPVAAAREYYKGKAVNANDAGIVATGAYVKGAYNAAISAINKVAATSADVNLSNLSETGTAVITTAITNNAAGANYDHTTSELEATTIQGAIDEVEGRVDTLEGTVGALGNTYATKEGVVATIESASVAAITGVSLTGGAGVSAYTDWTNEQSTTTLGAASLNVTKGRENVVITRTAGDEDTVANKYHALVSEEEHPNTVAANGTPTVVPYVDQQGESHLTVPSSPAPEQGA